MLENERAWQLNLKFEINYENLYWTHQILTLNLPDNYEYSFSLILA